MQPPLPLIPDYIPEIDNCMPLLKQVLVREAIRLQQQLDLEKEYSLFYADEPLSEPIEQYLEAIDEENNQQNETKLRKRDLMKEEEEKNVKKRKTSHSLGEQQDNTEDEDNSSKKASSCEEDDFSNILGLITSEEMPSPFEEENLDAPLGDSSTESAPTCEDYLDDPCRGLEG
ncbi:hypothetical protein J6590_033435 [Homalodisca vitripennis]|nr:hypothetical protein J6590_033435 [Homalodisca vitripennis]